MNAQEEEVGHVFEEDENICIKYNIKNYEENSKIDHWYLYSHDIGVMVHAGFLEEVKESKMELWSIDEIKEGDVYYVPLINGYVGDNKFLNCESKSIEFYVKSGQAHKTRESAELYYKQIMG